MSMLDPTLAVLYVVFGGGCKGEDLYLLTP